MTALSNAAENSLLLLIFNNTDFAGIGDAGGLQNSASAGSLYVSLHTSSPGEAGSQTTNEIGYTSYARVAVARSGAGWTVTNDTVENAASITFPESTGGTPTATHFGVGTADSGAGVLLFYGTLAAPLLCSSGVQPVFPAGALTLTAA